MKYALILIGLAVMAVSGVSAQTYDVKWNTLDGGGGSCTGGSFELVCTIGQPDAGSASAPLTGGTFELVGGYWTSSSVCECAGDMNLDGVRNGADIQTFVGCFLTGGSCSCADLDGSGGITAADMVAFVNALLTQTACP